MMTHIRENRPNESEDSRLGHVACLLAGADKLSNSLAAAESKHLALGITSDE
jgi:hypothetical protein